MKLLVPVDGSRCSLRAVDYVAAHRTRFDGDAALELHLVNVQPHLPKNVGRFVAAGQIADFHHTESERALSDAKAALIATGLAFVVHALVGAPAQRIVELGREIGCDLIVMGTHARTALAELLTGSVTLQVIHASDVPVLLVK